MAMNAKDIELRPGQRQPRADGRMPKGADWHEKRRKASRTFAHEALHFALANIAKPRGA